MECKEESSKRTYTSKLRKNMSSFSSLESSDSKASLSLSSSSSSESLSPSSDPSSSDPSSSESSHLTSLSCFPSSLVASSPPKTPRRTARRTYNSINTKQLRRKKKQQDDDEEEGVVDETNQEEATPLLIVSSSSLPQSHQNNTEQSPQPKPTKSENESAIISTMLFNAASTKYIRYIIPLLTFASCCFLLFYYSNTNDTTTVEREYDLVVRPIMEHHADHLEMQRQEVKMLLNAENQDDHLITSNNVYSSLVYGKEKEEEEKDVTLLQQVLEEDSDERATVDELLSKGLLQKEGRNYDYTEMISTNDQWEEPQLNSPSSDHSTAPYQCQYIDIWSGDGKKHRLNTARIIETSKRAPSQHWGDIPCSQHEEEENDSWEHDIQDNAAVISIRLPSSFTSSSNTEPETKRRQTIQGFGGSITEATSLNWRSLSPRAQNLVLQLFYDSRFGLGFTLGRVPINSCDFAVDNYNYDNVDGDFSMKKFDTALSHDLENGIIDMIQRAQAIVAQGGMYAGGTSYGERLKIVATPWSPPPWMKKPIPGVDKNNVSHASRMDGTATPECLKDGTGPESKYALSWANYFHSFLNAYKSHGIDIWAVTVQNAPVNVDAQWEGCAFSPSSEEEFIMHHLGPILRESYPDVNILVYDANREHAVEWMNYLWRDRNLDEKEENLGSDGDGDRINALDFMDGVAMQWYSDAKPSHMLDGALGTPNMHRVAEMAYFYQKRKEENMKKEEKEREKGLEEQETTKSYNLRHSSIDSTTTGIMDDNDSIMERMPILLDTEATHCSSTGYAIGDIDVSWYRAERNGHAILAQLAAGSNGWIEYNMVLDPIGGPNHVENFCDAPIVAVPHRAQSAVEFQLMPDFEHYQLKEGEVIMGEYETKFTLGSKMGYPPSYIDAGIVVQPMFYYTGHFSRYVRPGSTPLMALVGESPGGAMSRTFRPVGKTSPGGGNNNNAREGIEVTVWPCEGSTRQHWTMANEQLQTYRLNGYGEQLCVTLRDSVDVSLGGILLTDCKADDAASFTVVTEPKTDSDEADVVKFMTTKRRANECLGIEPLANGGGAYGPRGGAQAVLLPCDHESAIWHYSSKTGEVVSQYFSWDGPETNSGVCLTTGWPFLQAGAFDTSETTSAESDVVVVVLNESSDDANFVLATPTSGQRQPPTSLLKSSIPAHSIQTILL